MRKKTRKIKTPTQMVKLKTEVSGYFFPGLDDMPGIHICHILINNNSEIQDSSYSFIHLN